ncbi:MAG: peptidylprolyl isomerase, partial [Chloroflexi bacterium RBG_13_51_18]
FDSSIGKTPLTFTIGSGQVIPGFDNAVRGMKVGDIKTVTLPPEEAYGPHRDDLIAVLGRDQFPEGLTFTVGQRIPLQDDLGRQLTATIIEIGPSSITVDANHELAGKAL